MKVVLVGILLLCLGFSLADDNQGFRSYMTIDDFNLGRGQQATATVGDRGIIPSGPPLMAESGSYYDVDDCNLHLIGCGRDMQTIVSSGSIRETFTNVIQQYLSNPSVDGQWFTSCPFNGITTMTLQYDGNDEDFGSPNYMGLGGMDFTSQGNAQAFQFTLTSSNNYTSFISYKVGSSDGSICELSGALPEMHAPTPKEDSYVTHYFADFSGSCDFTDVGYLEVTLNINQGNFIYIQNLNVVGPDPSHTPAPSASKTSAASASRTPAPSSSVTPSKEMPSPAPSFVPINDDSDFVCELDIPGTNQYYDLSSLAYEPSALSPAGYDANLIKFGEVFINFCAPVSDQLNRKCKGMAVCIKDHTGRYQGYGHATSYPRWVDSDLFGRTLAMEYRGDSCDLRHNVTTVINMVCDRTNSGLYWGVRDDTCTSELYYGHELFCSIQPSTHQNPTPTPAPMSHSPFSFSSHSSVSVTVNWGTINLNWVLVILICIVVFFCGLLLGFLCVYQSFTAQGTDISAEEVRMLKSRLGL